MEVVWRLGYYTAQGGVGKIIGENGKYTATIGKSEKGMMTTKIGVLATRTFDTLNEASVWIQKNGYKSIRSEDHQRELGYARYHNWFTTA